LGEACNPACIPSLSALFVEAEPEPIQLATLDALQHYDRQEIGATLLGCYRKKSGNVLTRIYTALLSRKSWARALLKAVDQGELPATDIQVEQLRPIALFHDAELDALVRRHWGSLKSSTPEEKLAEIRRLNNDLNARGGGLSNGKALFRKHCATCHRLFNEGSQVGPDLTHLNRKNREYLLLSIVDPSAMIRKEYLSYLVHTTDGLVLNGLIAEQTANTVTLLGAKNERTRIPREKIELMEESPVSLMPENLLKELNPDQVRDLFSYLQSSRPN